MKTLLKPVNLEHALELVQTEKLSFEEICDLLFTFEYEDYDGVFNISKIKVANETYTRMPIYSGKFVAIIMIWGIDNASAIHDHKNYDGNIKVLKGTLVEVSYRENSNFIEYDSAQKADAKQVFPEEYEGIHSIVNTSDEISVSLHVYRTEQLHLEGVRIFDTVGRKIAYLSDKAKSCSWNLPEDSYSKIVKI